MPQLPTSEIHLDGIHCELTLQRYPRGVVILRISGTDIGEFGTRPMLALKEWLVDNQPIHLFIDARDVRGTSMSVSGEWAQWLRAQKANLQNISMLTGFVLRRGHRRFRPPFRGTGRHYADLHGAADLRCGRVRIPFLNAGSTPLPPNASPPNPPTPVDASPSDLPRSTPARVLSPPPFRASNSPPFDIAGTRPPDP